eukprot:TRINITY_DN7040_c0_g1_i1.p1 TRINITY_DN7040_c0_g1~~TRINITY_DN7040_c0_g1_i1.p1  ORF type:complete len:184 (+),score=42.87 TRINITY_DN7040_c0_g1_i1:150-701(+)
MPIYKCIIDDENYGNMEYDEKYIILVLYHNEDENLNEIHFVSLPYAYHSDVLRKYKSILYNDENYGNMEYDEKYIILVLYHNEDENLNEIHFVSLPYAYHSDVLRKYKSILYNDEKYSTGYTFGSSTVDGGGLVKVNRKEKTISTYGMSGGFGKPNADIVELILRKTMKDYNIDVTITNYIRG